MVRELRSEREYVAIAIRNCFHEKYAGCAIPHRRRKHSNASPPLLASKILQLAAPIPNGVYGIKDSARAVIRPIVEHQSKWANRRIILGESRLGQIELLRSLVFLNILFLDHFFGGDRRLFIVRNKEPEGDESNKENK
jgi:hypothetical protein